MKKKLEAELISIAHRILKLKNKSELNQLHQETQKLYEKLSVLRFVEDHFSEAKPTIGQAEWEQKVTVAFEEFDSAIEEVLPTASEIEAEIALEELELEEEILVFDLENSEEEAQEEAQKEEVEDELEDESETELDFMPHFEIASEAEIDEIEVAVEEVLVPRQKMESKQISFEDLLGGLHDEPVFERIVEPDDVDQLDEIEAPVADLLFEIESELTSEIPFSKENPSKSITFGLNDKVAFEKQLFGGSSEDMNRVISQLITFDTFQEAQDFIEEMVKPDYNNWEGKDEYVLRFMDIVERKFS